MVKSLQNKMFHPDWCGSVGWTSFCEPKGHGWIPYVSTGLGCRPDPWLGVCEGQPINVSLSYHVSLTLLLLPFPSF